MFYETFTGYITEPSSDTILSYILHSSSDKYDIETSSSKSHTKVEQSTVTASRMLNLSESVSVIIFLALCWKLLESLWL